MPPGGRSNSAVLKQKREMLSRAIVIISGGSGERDVRLDEAILAETGRFSDPALLNKELSLRTRPSHFLSQLPNLLAGNISILFGITGGSRTTMGEELAGSNAFKLGCDLIAEGSHDVALVGGAFNAERWDLLLLYGFGQFLWPHEYAPITLRCERGGGCILGTMAAFLVLEAREHAVAREAAVWCRVGGMTQRRTPRHRGDVANALNEMWREIAPPHGGPPAAVISGASGVAPWTEEERMELTALAAAGLPLRYSGSLFGHGMEASFLFNLGLAALALRHGCVYRPHAGDPAGHCEGTDINPVLVTGIGHFGGEAAALLCHA